MKALLRSAAHDGEGLAKILVIRQRGHLLWVSSASAFALRREEQRFLRSLEYIPELAMGNIKSAFKWVTDPSIPGPPRQQLASRCLLSSFLDMLFGLLYSNPLVQGLLPILNRQYVILVNDEWSGGKLVEPNGLNQASS